MSTAAPQLVPSSLPPARSRAARRDLGPRVRRVGLGVFFVSLAINAALGIGAVLAPDFGDTAVRVLQTSLLVTAFLLVCLAVEPAWERRRMGFVPPLTAVLGALTVGLTALLLWEVVESGSRLAGTGAVLTAGGVLLSLIGLARLRDGLRWVVPVDVVLSALLGGLMIGSIWFEPSSSAYERLTGVSAIALAAFVVATPVLHWVSRSALAVAEVTTERVRFCPFCGATLPESESGPVSVCGRCEHRFEVDVRDG